MIFKWLAWVTCATCLSIDGTEFGTFIDESFELNLNDIKGKVLIYRFRRRLSQILCLLTEHIRRNSYAHRIYRYKRLKNVFFVG